MVYIVMECLTDAFLSVWSTEELAQKEVGRLGSGYHKLLGVTIDSGGWQ